MCVSAELCVRAAAACTGGRRPHHTTCTPHTGAREPAPTPQRADVMTIERGHTRNTSMAHNVMALETSTQRASTRFPHYAVPPVSRPGPAVSTRMRSRAAAAPRTTTSVHTARMSRAARMGYAHSALGLLAFFSTAGVGAAGSTGVMSSTGPFFCSAASLALPHWVASRICSWEMPFFVIWVR